MKIAGRAKVEKQKGWGEQPHIGLSDTAILALMAGKGVALSWLGGGKV